jgi:flagellar biosynthesis/type III secretory pathway protein FliH
MSEAFVWPELKARPANPVAAAAALRSQAMEAGRVAGFEQGLVEGREAAAGEIESMRGELQAALERLEQTITDCRTRRLDELAATVHALCRKVLGWELTTSVEVLEEIVAEGLSRLEADDGAAEVYLHPEDHAVIVAGYHGNLVLHADPQVPRSGVSVRMQTQAADFDPGELIDELFEEVRRAAVG